MQGGQRERIGQVEARPRPGQSGIERTEVRVAVEKSLAFRSGRIAGLERERDRLVVLFDQPSRLDFGLQFQGAMQKGTAATRGDVVRAAADIARVVMRVARQ